MTTLNIYAAGSLRIAFPALAELFKQSFSTEIHIKFGPAGLLCEKLLQKTPDDNIHLFASANTLHPKTLIDHGKAISDYVFAHNRLCVTVRNESKWTSSDIIKLLLHPETRIGMSTPQKDPSGDYTFQLFDNIGTCYEGMGEQLKHRAKQLVGGSLESHIPKAMHPAEFFLLNNTVDAYIGYANYAQTILQNPKLAMINLPAKFNPAIDYSIALLKPAHKMAKLFIGFLLSENGQNCLMANGFGKITNIKTN